MKGIVFGLFAVVSLCFADVKKGDVVTSTGTYGCATQQGAIGMYDAEKAVVGKHAGYVQGYMGVVKKKYSSCRRITSGLNLKVYKTEDWGPKENRFKYKLLMVALPNNDYLWTILK